MGYLLPHYLRTLRRRSGLTQADLAYLLGSFQTAKISRYERFKQQPGLETALAYEAIFGTPASSIFAGTFAEVEAITKRRARALAQEVRKRKATPVVEHKLVLLDDLSGKRPLSD